MAHPTPGRICITPLWLVLYCADDPPALLVWCYIAAHYGNPAVDEELALWPEMLGELTEELNLSPDDVDICIELLTEGGALEIDGDQVTVRTERVGA